MTNEEVSNKKITLPYFIKFKQNYPQYGYISITLSL